MIAPSSSSSLVVQDRFEPGSLENEIVPFEHRLLETGLFDDEALVELVASHPREFVNVSKPIDHSTDRSWGEGDWTGVEPAQLIDLVRDGRLWINVRHLVDHQPRYRELLHGLFSELESKCDGYRTFDHYAGLLISSPTAKVPYHLDIPYVILWHVRGKKRIWIYPVEDRNVMPYDRMEACVAGAGTEDIPYDPEWDGLAQVLELEPGMALAWPQNGPHRVENVEGLNVSLTTEHYTERARRHVRALRANRFLRTKLGLPCRSPRTDGVGYWAKQLAYGTARGIDKLVGRPDPGHHPHPMTFKIDPNAPGGTTKLES